MRKLAKNMIVVNAVIGVLVLLVVTCIISAKCLGPYAFLQCRVLAFSPLEIPIIETIRITFSVCTYLCCVMFDCAVMSPRYFNVSWSAISTENICDLMRHLL